MLVVVTCSACTELRIDKQTTLAASSGHSIQGLQSAQLRVKPVYRTTQNCIEGLCYLRFDKERRGLIPSQVSAGLCDHGLCAVQYGRLITEALNIGHRALPVHI